MKKLLRILILVKFVFISCNEKNGKKTENKKVIVEKQLIKKEIEIIKTKAKIVETETQINKTQTRKYGKLILENKIYPSDNDETFECIKQLFTKDKNDLEFYFKVFRIIVQKSDGALSEVMGIEIMKFMEFNPDYFIEQYSKFEFDEKNRFIGHIAYEFYFSEPEHNAEIERYFEKVNSKFELTTEPKRKYLNSIKELTKKATEEIINE